MSQDLEGPAMIRASAGRLHARHALVLTGAVALFLALTAVFWQFTIDDAYITFRYADNLARGLGPVYNAGERVEGYTSFVWMLLMTAVHRLAWQPAAAAKLIGLLCSLLTLWMTYRLAALVSRRPQAVAMLAVLGLITHVALALNAVMGLEMPLYTLLLVLAVYSYLDQARNRAWWLSTLLFGLAALTRPEGLAVFGLTMLYQALVVRERWPRMLARLLLFGSIVGSHLLWRHGYYGEWLPNTYYAKTGDLVTRLRAGGLYVVEAMVGPGLFLGAGYLGALRHRNRRLGYLCWLCGGYAAVIVWEGGDWMPGLRFWVPILPFLYLILAEQAVNLHDRLQMLSSRRLRSLALVLVGTMGALYLALATGYGLVTYLYTSVRANGYREAHDVLADWLRHNTTPDSKVALMDIGIVGYYTELPIIDLAGLTNRQIAHAPGSFQEKAYDPDYVLQQQPDYVVLVSTDSDSIPDFPIDLRIYESPRFRANYEYIFRLSHLGDGDGAGYYLLVFERRVDPESLS